MEFGCIQFLFTLYDAQFGVHLDLSNAGGVVVGTFLIVQVVVSLWHASARQQRRGKKARLQDCSLWGYSLIKISWSFSVTINEQIH